MIKKGKTEDGVNIEIILSENAKKQGKIEGEVNDLFMEITDIKGDKYEAIVKLEKGWTQDDLQGIITDTCLLCDAVTKSIKATFLGAPTLH